MVAKVDDLQEGSMLFVAVSGNPILLSRIGGQIYAMDAVCSHYNGFLPRGQIKDYTLVCPVHKAEFDVRTGDVTKNVSAIVRLATRREATRLRTYEVKIVDGSIGLKIR